MQGKRCTKVRSSQLLSTSVWSLIATLLSLFQQSKRHWHIGSSSVASRSPQQLPWLLHLLESHIRFPGNSHGCLSIAAFALSGPLDSTRVGETSNEVGIEKNIVI